MNWALVATIEKLLTFYQQPNLDENGNPISNGQWSTEKVQPGTIVNIIVYDGESTYTPPEGTRLEQVPSTAKIGDVGY